ncbi:hypothetical protein [Spongiactinospora sp. 9N601]|uniref:hypothetical protein n=1 Tax=Spongiactinospora sp. 9N601 TaxID=3375149 RepID=UPI0037BA70ED
MTTADAGGTAPRSIDELIGSVGTFMSRAVEAQQVAAILESQGLNDKIARERYGHPDVFSLAAAAYSRIAETREPGPATEEVLPRARPAAQMVHGLLYALPAVLLPAASGLVGARWLMPGMVLTTGLGWILSSTAAQIAYSLIGRGMPGSAGRVLRSGLLLGVLAGVLMSATLALYRNAPAALVALGATQMAFQLSSGILLLYRREKRLAVLMLPAAAAGVVYIGVGEPEAALFAVCLGVACVAAITGAAVRLTLRTTKKEPALRTLLRADLRGLLPSFVYSLLSATFLLQAEAPYVLDRIDIAVAGAGLVLGMGVLEYRAHAFEDEARALIRRVRYPAEFIRRAAVALARGVVLCLLALSVLAVLPLAFLHATGALSHESVVMAAAHVTVGGAYFLGFLLANQGKVVLLCVAQGMALAVHPGTSLLLPAAHVPLADVGLFLGAAALFLLLLLVLAASGLRDVHRFC